MRKPVHIEIATHGSTADHVQQEMIILQQDHKKQALVELINRTTEAVIVFTRTKFQARNLNRWLRAGGFASEELHGNRSLPQRKKAVAALLSKQSRVLVATDIAARGIDIPHVELVINYDLPDQAEDYVHRIGRTGRAGRKGHAISLVATDQALELRDIQRLIKTQIAQTSLESIPAANLDMQASASAQRERKGGGRRGGRGRGGARGGHRGAGRSGGFGGGNARGRRRQRRGGFSGNRGA